MNLWCIKDPVGFLSSIPWRGVNQPYAKPSNMPTQSITGDHKSCAPLLSYTSHPTFQTQDKAYYVVAKSPPQPNPQAEKLPQNQSGKAQQRGGSKEAAPMRGTCWAAPNHWGGHASIPCSSSCYLEQYFAAGGAEQVAWHWGGNLMISLFALGGDDWLNGIVSFYCYGFSKYRNVHMVSLR